MFLNSNFSNKSSLIKPIIIVVVALLVIGGVYTFFSKKPAENANEKTGDQALEIKSSGIDKDQKIRNVGDVEEVLAKWVEANPKAILAPVANMQRKMMEEQAKTAQKNIGPKKDELFNDKNSPSYSPKGYDVTVVEFFDYNCGYCKKTNPTVEALIKADSKVIIIYKEFPILGQVSEDLSSVALAVNIADSASYKKFHDALMSSNVGSKEEALKLAASIGINASKVEAVLKSQKDKIAKIINDNRTLGASIGVNGTPGFVIGEELIPGALGVEALQQKVSEQRKK